MSDCSEMSRSMESALDDNNLLAEFLLRLPPLPSSLRRASLVCKRWRSIVSEPHFLRRFRSHHRKAPLLGFVCHDFVSNSSRFISTLDSPDRIPDPHFSLQLGDCGRILDSHHGLVLILYFSRFSESHLHVWDPVIRDHRHVALPQAFHGMYTIGGVVLCAVQDQGHVHGACHSHPFKVVLVGFKRNEFYFSVYSSETGAWSDTITISLPLGNITILSISHSYLIGNSVCWFFGMETLKILQFDLDEQNVALIDVPSYVCDVNDYIDDRQDLTIMPMDSGSIKLVVLEDCTVRVWKWMSNGTVGARWILGNTLELNNLLSLRPFGDEMPVMMLAPDEDGNVMFKLADGSAIMVHIGTMQFKKLAKKIDNSFRSCHPFRSFYTPEI